MTASTDPEVRTQIVATVRDFVHKEVAPIARRYDNEDLYPHHLIDPMRKMGLFGITIPEEYGGLGLDHTTFAMIFEELSKGWMSVSGIIGTHHVMAHIIARFGTPEQKERILPRLASGELRGALGLTEPEAGSDVQNIQMTAVRDGEEYVLNGSKMFITNGEHGNAIAVLAKTDPDAEPRHRGMSCFIVEKPSVGLNVGQHLDKLGYRGLDSVELLFQDCRVPTDNLIGGVEGQGFKHVMYGLEGGRINVAARAVGHSDRERRGAIRGHMDARHPRAQLRLHLDQGL